MKIHLENHSVPPQSERSAEWALSRRQLLRTMGAGALGVLSGSCSPASTPGPAPKSSVDLVDAGPLHYASLSDVGDLIASGQLSPVALTESMLERINALDGGLRSYATVLVEQALGAARTAEQEIQAGRYRGPLHGIPIAVKDLCFTEGTRTMGGLRVLKDFVPDFDATVVTRLKDAGAVLLGKLNLTEGAMAGYHPDFDIPVNPWGQDLWAGASSSGSAVATAAGLCFASLGTDTGGSIRYPAMANGVVGLKPTYGRVSRYGVLALAESMDHVGPMTRRTLDAAIVLEAMAGFDPNDPTSLSEPVPHLLEETRRGAGGLRIGFDRGFTSQGVDPHLVTSIEAALEHLDGLGAEIVDVQMPEVTGPLQDSWFAICAFEARAAHREHYPSQKELYGAYLGEFLASAAEVTEADYASASQMRSAFNEGWHSVLSTVDAVACPAGGVPFAFAQELQYGGMDGFNQLIENLQLRFTFPADFAGTPTLSLPCGFSEAGLPYTIQFMGRRLSESVLCRLGHAYEESTDWHTRHPAV